MIKINPRKIAFLPLFAIYFLLIGFIAASPALCQDSSAELLIASNNESNTSGDAQPVRSGTAQVRAGSSVLFTVTDTDHLTARARAEAINSRIIEVLGSKSLNPQRIDLHVEPGGDISVKLENMTLAIVRDSDSKMMGLSKEILAERWSAAMRARLSQLQPVYTAAEKPQHAVSGKDTGMTAGKPLEEHRVLLFLLQVALLLFMACLCGELMVRIGQPAVIGQLLAGIILGPSVLGAIAPAAYMTIFPPENTQGYLLDIVSWLGVIFLLMLTGTETDIELIKSQGKRAMATSVGGILFPFLLGFGVAFIVPDTMLVLPSQRVILGAFIGTVFSMSSVAIIAKVLIDMKLMRRNVGQLILASALVQDVVGCVVLAVVAAFASTSDGGMFDLLKVPIGLAIFVAVGATIGKTAILNGLRWVHDKTSLSFAAISYVAVLLLVCAAITQFIGVHVVLGAFAVGVIIAQSPLMGERVLHPIEAITMGIFAPIFFAAAGLHVNLTLLKEPELLFIAVVTTLMACLGKIVGSLAGGYLINMDKWESLCVGLGTNARGAMGLIVGILGFSLGILTVNMFTIIVIMSLATTAMTPFLLGRALSKVAITPEEKDRLEREEKQSGTLITKIHRVLVPIKEGTSRELSSRLLSTLGSHHSIEATSLTLYDTKANVEKYVSETLMATSKEGNVTIVNRAVQSDDLAGEILKEAKKEYDLIVMEPGKLYESDKLGGGLIDRVAKESPCPILIVKESPVSTNWDIKRILIPTTGVGHASMAIQLGILLAKGTGADVIAQCVIEEHRVYTATMSSDEARRDLVAHEAVNQVVALADAFGVEVVSQVSYSSEPAMQILDTAQALSCDLIVLGASIRPGKQLHFGDTIERLLSDARCHVAVVSP